jgi:chemotaxis protein methyltransferase CheR
MWLLENWALVDAYNIEIIGSDIDTRALADAARGVYGARAVSRLQPDVIARYFDVARAGEAMAAYAIIQDLRESVRFTPVNLMDAASVAAQGRFDVILCRNVMIYFDDTARAQAAAHLYGALNPGGFICLGHTESMTRISERFLMRRLPDAIVYQRPGDSP